MAVKMFIMSDMWLVTVTEIETPLVVNRTNTVKQAQLSSLNACTNFCLCVCHGSVPTYSWRVVTGRVAGRWRTYRRALRFIIWPPATSVWEQQSGGGEVTCVRHLWRGVRGERRGASAHFDEPSEPERRQPLGEANWPPRGWRERDRGGEKRAGRES